MKYCKRFGELNLLLVLALHCIIVFRLAKNLKYDSQNDALVAM